MDGTTFASANTLLGLVSDVFARGRKGKQRPDEERSGVKRPAMQRPAGDADVDADGTTSPFQKIEKPRGPRGFFLYYPLLLVYQV